MTNDSGMTTRPYIGFVNGENGYDPLEPVDNIEAADTIFMEDLLHHLPKEQLEVLACRYLGFKPKEIVEILAYKNIARYYNVNAKLRTLCRERKIDAYEL